LIIVKLIENYKGKEPKNLLDAMGTYLAAAIGALSLSFSDTFWFSAVESEVYASSTFLLAAIVYLMMRWNERAGAKDNEKYILLIAYLIGVSTAVHLMSVLAINTVVMVVIFRKYILDDEALKKSGYVFLAHFVIIILVAMAMWAGQTGTEAPSPEEYKAFDLQFIGIMILASAIIAGIFWKKVFHKNSFYLPIAIGSVALVVTYPGVVKILPKILTTVSNGSSMTAVAILFILLGGLGYIVYYATKNSKPTLQLTSLSLIFIILGFTTYALVIIRSNVNPPMNENEPKTFPELVSYLNREQYGEFPQFKRRFSNEPHQTIVYDENHYPSDLAFWWKYQMNHMETRYQLWNYVGRESWEQDSGVDIWPFNSIGNIFGGIFNIRFAGDAKDSLFGIPMLLGLLGIYFHFRKDWKMASAYMVLFIFMGYLTAFYQNQQQPQPRERDYFYVGAFFVFSAWIGFAIRAIIDKVQEVWADKPQLKPAIIGVLALGIIFVPARMLQANYYSHDRSKNYVAWDYSYNLLQSCEKDAILFTNGDNDTFPLWYLQDVEGVRRDVRIVNLSLANTGWYVKQIKDLQPYPETKPVKIAAESAYIEKLQGLVEWASGNVDVPIPDNIIKEYNIKDSTALTTKTFSWYLKERGKYGGQTPVIQLQDWVVKEVVQNNMWDRPIYFAVTCPEDSKIGLQDYLRTDGMTLRLVPVKQTNPDLSINEPLLRKQLFTDVSASSKTFQPGLQFRGLNDPSVFLDDNHQRMTQNYRNAFIKLASYYRAFIFDKDSVKNNEMRKQKVVETFAMMEKRLPVNHIKLEFYIAMQIADILASVGAQAEADKMNAKAEQNALHQIEIGPVVDDNPEQQDITDYAYQMLLRSYIQKAAYQKSLNLLDKYAVYSPAQAEAIAQQKEYIRSLMNPPKGQSVPMNPASK
jgi:hypothetical protein